jgi:hypothetical protein
MKLDLDRMGVRASDLIFRPGSDNKSDKVMATIEEALLLSPIEWIE